MLVKGVERLAVQPVPRGVMELGLFYQVVPNFGQYVDLCIFQQLACKRAAPWVSEFIWLKGSSWVKDCWHAVLLGSRVLRVLQVVFKTSHQCSKKPV